jgi:hypothetical protein
MPDAIAHGSGSNGFAVSRNLNPKLVSVSSLTFLGRETRKHPPAQIRKLAESLNRFGFVVPIVVDRRNRVVAGWGLVLAARRLGLDEVPAVIISDLGEAELRLLRLALNRLAEDSSWDENVLKLEFNDVLEISNDLDLTVSGFEMGEIDRILSDGIEEEDALPVVDEAAPPITKPGDLWRLGDHGLLCGDALAEESYRRLMGGDRAQMVLSDPPWNIPIEDNVSGLGAVKHKDFAMACGEMTPAEFVAFLTTFFSFVVAHSQEGALNYIFMHWSKMKEMLAAAEGVFAEFLNLCVWSKTNAGMGSLYRSQHELIFVFKSGAGPHINNVRLGRFGRHRTNCWSYPGQNIFNGTAKSKLKLHPTAKPVALVADAIRDASRRGGIVLDPFGGAGSTLIAAEKTGRRARLIELEPRYVDATIRRWEALTGRRAALEQAAPESIPSDPDNPAESIFEQQSPPGNCDVRSKSEEAIYD